MDAEEVVTETTAVSAAVEQSLTALLEAGYGNWTVRQALMLLLLGRGKQRGAAPGASIEKHEANNHAGCR